MTYKELYEKAAAMLDRGEITLGDFNKMVKPLDVEIHLEPHWIPVTERLPETEGRYIVVNSKIGAWHVDIDFYRPYMGGWMYDQGVLAWMPLPEPFKGVTE